MPGSLSTTRTGWVGTTDAGFVFEPGPNGLTGGGDVSAPRSVFRSRVPSPPLAEFVDGLWFYRCDASVRVRERALPTETMGLFFDLRDPAGWPLVSGARSTPYAVDATGGASLIGVRFKPGGAFPFVDVPAGELHDAHAPLDAFWGRGQTDALRARLLDAETPEAGFRILERALLERLTRPPARDPAVAYALRAFRGGPHAPTVGEVAEQVGLGSRAFLRAFTTEVGLTPKLFCRIRRFQGVLRRVQTAWGEPPFGAAYGPRGEGPSGWAGLAYDCGYYDQAHLVNDFRALSGYTPTAYLRAWRTHLDYGARYTC